MKHIISFSMLLLSSIFILQSCSKAVADDAGKAPPAKTISVTLSAGTHYSFNMSGLTSVRIARQAAHFAISQVETNDGAAVYKYASQNNYAGTDEVQLTNTKTTYHSGGGCNGGGNEYTSTHNSTIIIKFTVTK